MSMVINTNIQATRTHNVYSKNNEYMNQAMTRVATGMKINSAKDNASVWAISEKMRERIRANDQANQNIQNDTALLKTAQGGVSNTVDILTTLKERAVNAANDSNLNTDRSKIALEVKELVQQIDENAAKVKFNGRTLLNGAGDNTIGSLSATTDTSSAATVSANPVARGSNAIYSLGNLSVYGGTVSDSTKLTALTKTNATSASDTLINASDKITFSWKENGDLKTAELNVTSATALSDLNSVLTKSKLKGDWIAVNNSVAEKGTAANKIVKSNGDEYKTPSAGYYLVGDANTAITDFSVSVTHTLANGETVNRTEAQEALSATGIQNAYTNQYGSDSVWSTKLQLADATKGVSGSNETKFSDMVIGNTTTKAFGSTDITSVTFTINGEETTVSAGSTINDLNKAFEDKGFDVRAVLLNKGETVNYGGTAVQNGTGENASDLKALAGGLFLVGINGYDITSAKVSATTSSGGSANLALDGLTDGTTLGNFARYQSRADDSSSSSSASPALTFFVGGEANFGVNFSIGNMTVNSLLGTSVGSFAEKFTTKSGAESAISMIDNALSKALTEQTKLAAMENRLGYASDNLVTMNENLEAADSAYRDSDIAKDMTAYMKYSVLAQASQYMLAQSSQNAFSVLNLLQA